MVPADADEDDNGGAEVENANAENDHVDYDEEDEHVEEQEYDENVAVPASDPAAVNLGESAYMLAPASAPGPANNGGDVPAISADQAALLGRIETMLGGMETRIHNTNEARLVHHREALEQTIMKRINERIPGMMRAAVREELNNQQNTQSAGHRHALPSSPDRPRQSGSTGSQRSAGSIAATAAKSKKRTPESKNPKKRTHRQANAPAPFDPAVGLPTTSNVTGGAAPAGIMSDAQAAQLGLVRRQDPVVRRHGYGDGLGGPVAGHFPSPPRRPVAPRHGYGDGLGGPIAGHFSSPPRRPIAPSAGMLHYLDQQLAVAPVASGDSITTAEQPLITDPAGLLDEPASRPRADSQTTLVNGEPGAPIAIASDDDTEIEVEV
jgi:hypothetical protein